LTFKDMTRELTFPPQEENGILGMGFLVPVHPMDDHMQHMQIHGQFMQQTGDPQGVIKVHMMAHAQALQAAQQQTAPMGPPPGMQPGGPKRPGNGQQRTGQPPKPGASPMQQRPAQQPPGAIHADRFRDPRAAPRQ